VDYSNLELNPAYEHWAEGSSPHSAKRQVHSLPRVISLNTTVVDRVECYDNQAKLVIHRLTSSSPSTDWILPGDVINGGDHWGCLLHSLPSAILRKVLSLESSDGMTFTLRTGPGKLTDLFSNLKLSVQGDTANPSPASASAVRQVHISQPVQRTVSELPSSTHQKRATTSYTITSPLKGSSYKAGQTVRILLCPPIHPLHKTYLSFVDDHHLGI